MREINLYPTFKFGGKELRRKYSIEWTSLAGQLAV